MTVDKNSLVFVGVKISKSMLDLMDKAVRQDTHIDRSEFLRDAIRSELKRRGLI